MKKFKEGLPWKLIFVLSVYSSTVFAQEIEWQKTIGGSGKDQLTSIKQTNDGGYIIGGYSDSNISGDKTEWCIGSGSDYWIVKIDSLGSILWQNTIGGGYLDRLESIQQTYDGGYILGGTSNSIAFGDKTENTLGGNDFWIVKTDVTGNILWQNTIGGMDGDELKSIQQTVDGGYILGGQSKSNISSDKIENSKGGYDYWLLKIDSLGNNLWQKTIGGIGNDYFTSLLITNDNGFLLGGYSNSDSSSDKTENSNGSFDFWVVKTDSLGSIQWQNTIGGNASESLYSMQQSNDGGYILGGASESNISGDKTEECKGVSDFWIVKTDVLGSIQWQKTIGGSGLEMVRSIQQTMDSGYILCGASYSDISGDKMERNAGFMDFWLIKTDGIGNIQWQNTLGGNDDDLSYSVLQTSKKNFIVGGYSRSGISGDKTAINKGDYDYWIIKLTDHYNLISGKFYADFNSNGIQEIGEPPLPTKKLTEQNTGRFAFTSQNGNYSLAVLDSGNFSVSPQSVNWYSPSPLTHPAFFNGINQTDSLNDFAYQPLGVFEDVCVTITPLGNFRSGFNASYMISYGNYGTTTVSNPVLYFYPYGNVTFQSATVTPNQNFPDSVIWNLPSLTPFQTSNIIVTVNVNLGLPIGTLINSSAHIEPYATDDNPSCNNSNWEVYTSGSFDPNDILVNEDTLTTTQLNNSSWLEYIIRFQNTGNDTAFTVKILNPIDTNKLNLSTFEFTSASHPVNLNWINYQRNMEFKFENILLPDSNTNEPLSHGFVRYRIQPKTNLSAGDSITNFAAIYFDFNEPVITNIAKTVIILPTGIASASPTRGKLHVFPNPTENNLNISGILLENGKAQLRLTDIYGKLIFEKTVTSTIADIETTNLPSGPYLIQSGASRATFMKQ